MRRHREAVLERARHLRRDVLHERAATDDVQDLDAAADREDRKIAAARFGNQRRLELVTLFVDIDHRLVGRLAVPARRDVLAAGQQQPADAFERVRHRHRRVEHTDLAADMQHGLPVVFELPTRRDSNGHGNYRLSLQSGRVAIVLHPCRNFNPHQIEGARSAATGNTRRRRLASASGRPRSSFRIG